VSAGTDSTAEGSAISLPKGGGAVSGLGEKFSPDLFTGTGNFSVPVAVPAGRLGLQPQLSLGYSTGSGNGPFGLGWQLSVPGVSRKTSRGVPRYVDAAGAGEDRADVFVLSSAEDLVPVAGSYPGRVRYRPRTEGLFARIEHVRDDSGNYWEVRSRDGLLTRYGTPRPAGADPAWQDPAAVSDPADPARVFGWRITQTQDQLGNLIRYDYQPDRGQDNGHTWDHPLLSRISYADYGDRADPSFLVTVDFEYEPRPDPFSDYRSGFEIRTTRRCHLIRITTHAADGVARVAREYRFGYEQATFNGVSLLTTVDVAGIDDQGLAPGQPAAEEHLPPLTFGYSGFDPAGRRFEPLTGPGLPAAALSDPALALVDVRGAGLPDVVELGAAQRVWRNAGGGRFELPRLLAEAPPFSLGDPGVQFMDADGDGRPDLVVPGLIAGGGSGGRSNGTPAGAVAGYFPMTFAAGWSRRSFQPYAQSPAISLADPGVKLVDLDGDGLTDVLASGPGARLQCWFNDADPRRAWRRTAVSNGTVPDLDLADPRVRLADMTGDGLQDLVLVRNGNLAYWPNLGHGRWGAMVTMRRSPRLPDGHDPRRVLLGDLDGDGAADLVYVDDGRVQVWGNQSGNAWTEQPVTITGTPGVVDTDAIQLSDLHGTGMAGLLFSRAADGSGRPHLRFLDLTGGVKPHLLTRMDNHLGARTRVTYRPSTAEYLRDQADPATRWRTTLPFPVQVVSQVEVTDAFSGGRLTTQYRYHHGYWDGAEREFRGFAMVEHLDTETFAQATAAAGTGTAAVPEVHYCPPTLTTSWFHPGPVAAVEAGDWTELDLRHEYWDGDPPMLARPPEQTAFLAGLSRTARRAALRTLRGQLLRSELYALDGTGRQDLPYTVTEALSGVREESPLPPPAPGQPGDSGERVFFPSGLGQRTTQWERGDQPMTQFTFPAGYDKYGYPTGQVAIAVPRGRDPRVADPAAGQPYLATHATTTYARRDDDMHYLVDRVCQSTSYEIVNDGTPSVSELRDAVLAGLTGGGNGVSLRVIGHSRTFYDGEAFVGLPAGELGEHGLPLRAESLAFTGGFLDSLYPGGDPLAVSPRPAYLAPGPVSWPEEYPAEFRDLLPELAGYRHYADADVPGSPGGYYIARARHRYDVHVPGRVPRGLLVESLDPLGALSRIGYDDQHDLLPVRGVDAAGLETLAVNDYRVLQPRELTDPNGNTTSVTFSPAGLVTARFVRGKGGEGDKDAPSVQMSYDLLAFTRARQPASVTSTRRVHHDTDAGAEADQLDDVIESREFSDGFGRVLQTRSQAEDTLFGDPVFGGGVIPADQSAAAADTVGHTRATRDNVIVSGWQVYDNKGRVVQKYEPFFAVGFEYSEPAEAQLGQKTTIFYDPRGRAIRTLNPDGSEQRVVLGVPAGLRDPDVYQPTAWESYAYDANDNAGRTHPAAATAYQDHWNTPASVEVDALGRTVAAIARNAVTDQDSAWITTRSAYDIQGNVVSITDALGREAFRYRFDLAKRRWRMDSIDAGRRDSVVDALGHPIESRDSKGALTLGAFDLLRRPARVWARDDPAGPVTLRQRIDYGDAGDPKQPADKRAAARAQNLLGRPVRSYDEAGLVTTAAVDFKGNVLESARRVIADAPILATYKAAQTNDWQVTPFQVNWTPGPAQTQADRDAELLEPAGYATTTAYDALNRVTQHTFPADVEGRRRELHPTYNRAGGLEQVRLGDTVYVQRIAYDAKGQRSLIAYGNGVMTRYAYQPQTFRLARLRSEPYTLIDGPGGPAYRPGGAGLQDYGYDYDLAGNILTIRDRTPGSGIPSNPQAFAASDPILGQLLINGNALDRQFTYDPLYRLLSATGREHQTPPGGDPWIDLPRGTDITQAQAYQETYHYDPVGNMLDLIHASTGGFTRHFTIETGTNRLQRMTIATTPYDYTFDGNGNLRSETTSRHFDWGHADQLKAFRTQTDGAEPSVHAHYLYDAAGQRVKKLVRKQGGQIEVTHYIDGVFEHHRWGPASQPGENNLVHVMDDKQRIALVRAGPAHPDDRGPAVAIHLADHLGSSTAVLDANGILTNREEFTPYGETSFGSYTRKRYRFTGHERDEESGLAYYHSRYFATWLARWVATDPAGPVDGCNAFTYVRNNPLHLIDPAGTQSEEANSTPASGDPPSSTNLTCDNSHPAGYYVAQGAFRDEADQMSAAYDAYGEHPEGAENTSPLASSDANGCDDSAPSSPPTPRSRDDDAEEGPLEFTWHEFRVSIDGEIKTGLKGVWREVGPHAKLSIQPTVKAKLASWLALTFKGPGAWAEGRATFSKWGADVGGTAGVNVLGSVGVELSGCIYDTLCLGGELEVGPKLELGGELGERHARGDLPFFSVGAGVWPSDKVMENLRSAGEEGDAKWSQVLQAVAPVLKPQNHPEDVILPFQESMPR
jgi:RHS repeat-associated protein